LEVSVMMYKAELTNFYTATGRTGDRSMCKPQREKRAPIVKHEDQFSLNDRLKRLGPVCD